MEGRGPAPTLATQDGWVGLPWCTERRAGRDRPLSPLSVCNAGRWSCKDPPCPGTCALEGGSHITTFDGKKYTFHGDCYYVLTRVGGAPAHGRGARVGPGRLLAQASGLPQGEHNDSYALLGELAPCGSTDKQTCLKTVVLLLDRKKNVGTPAHPPALFPAPPPGPLSPGASCLPCRWWPSSLMAACC